jgi:hypothetical protein
MIAIARILPRWLRGLVTMDSISQCAIKYGARVFPQLLAMTVVERISE